MGVSVLVLVLGAVGVVIGRAVDCRQNPEYESVAALRVLDHSDELDDLAVLSDYLIERKVSLQALATGREVLQRVEARLGSGVPWERMQEMVSAVVTGEGTKSALVAVQVRAARAAVAQQIAQADVEVLADYLAEIEVHPISASVIQRATRPTRNVAC